MIGEGAYTSKKSDLLALIEEKLAEKKSEKEQAPKDHQAKGPRVRKPHTKAESNVANSAHSTGPRTPEGKAKVSANSLKHGFYANVTHLHPNDSPLYTQTLDDLREGLHPDGPAEEHIIRELAMLSARLKRLEAMEFALAMANIEGPPAQIKEDIHNDFTPPVPQIDARDLAASYLTSLDHIERLQKIELHLRRAYNRTWDRLQRMQKGRKNMPLDQALKQSQIWATYEATKTNNPRSIPNATPPSTKRAS